MAAPQTAGIDKRGNPIYLRHPDGREIVDEEGNHYLNDEIDAVTDHFRIWICNQAFG
jgi:type I restriction enzyme M protein